MSRDKIQKTKHKNPKFRESYDEEFCDDDQMEMQKRRKKMGKRSQWKNTDKEKW